MISDLSEEDRAAAEGALLMLLRRCFAAGTQGDGGSVRRGTLEAPAAIVRSLSTDQPVGSPFRCSNIRRSCSMPIWSTSSPPGNDEMQCAIARRGNLPPSVCAAIAEVGSASAALELIENPPGRVGAVLSWDPVRIVERHGHLAAIREAMLVLEDLPAATRAAWSAG